MITYIGWIRDSGKCSVCGGSYQLVKKSGYVRYHGPHSKPCTGGGKPPVVEAGS